MEGGAGVKNTRLGHETCIVRIKCLAASQGELRSVHDRVDRHRTAYDDVDYRGASRKYEAGDVFGENATWQADENGGKDKSFLSTILDHARHEEGRQILVGGQAKRKDSFSSSSIRRQPTTALPGIGTSISFKPSLPPSTPYFRNPKMRHGARRRRRWVVEEPSVSLAHVLGPGAKAASWEQDQIHSPVKEEF